MRALSTTPLSDAASPASVAAVPAPPVRSESPAGLRAGDVLPLILSSLEENKAEEILSIDLAGKTSIADAMVVASGRSHRHVGALAGYVVEALKAKGVTGIRVEGEPACDWVLIDAGDVIVHVFRPEVRAFYNLEKMWSGARPSERASERGADRLAG